MGLCRRLDGLPLAIELAAVRTRVLSPDQILDRLGDRFALLTGGSRAALPRHQTLRTTIEWSHDLLAPEERTLLRRLCVFAGRFTLEDVESICTSDDVRAPRVLNVLSSLVDKSLAAREESQGPACYRLHETMREYAVLKLREAGEEDRLEERCTGYYVSRCLGAEAGARYRLVEWLGWMDLEADNIRSVLGRCLTRADVSVGMDLAASLRWFWYTRATTEGVRWLDGLLAIGPGDPEPQARAEYLRGMLAVLLVDPAAATPHLERAASANREAGRLHPLTESLSMASIAASMAGDRASAHRLLDEAASVAAGIDGVGAALAVLQARAFAGLFEGDLEAVRAACSDGERLSREVGDIYGLKTWLMHLGMASLIAGELGASKPLFVEALRIAHQIDDRVQQGYLLNALGCHAARIGNARLAAQLLGASDTIRAGAGNRMMPFLVPMLQQAEDSASARLGATRFAAEFDVGRHLGRDAAVRLAIDEPSRMTVADTDDSAGDALLSIPRDGGRTVDRGWSEQQGDRSTPVHLRSHRRQPRPQHPEQVRSRLARPDRGPHGVVGALADTEVEQVHFGPDPGTQPPRDRYLARQRTRTLIASRPNHEFHRCPAEGPSLVWRHDQGASDTTSGSQLRGRPSGLADRAGIGCQRGRG